jgi:hypothetical protein
MCVLNTGVCQFIRSQKHLAFGTSPVCDVQVLKTAPSAKELSIDLECAFDLLIYQERDETQRKAIVPAGGIPTV